MINNNQSKMDKCLLSICVLLLVKLLVAMAVGSWRSCESHRDCKNFEFTQCNGGECSCLPNYERINYEGCKGKINATCDFDYDCSSPVEDGCIFNTCQSYATFFISSNADRVKLYRATRVGSRCEIDENCSDLDNTMCKSGKCDCVSGYWKYDIGICRPVTNATCANDSDCKESGTKCLLDSCILPTDFFDESNAVNVSLYTAKKFGDPCQTDHHCRHVNLSECKNGACDCIYGSTSYYIDIYSSNSISECQKIVNVSCNTIVDCDYNSGVDCFLNTCLFPKDFFVPSNAHNVSLYAATNLRDICQTDHHCRNINNTHCIDEKCKCKQGFAIMYGECYKSTELFCNNDVDCKIYNYIVDVMCFSNVCQEVYRYFDSVNIRQYRTKWVEEYCKIDDNCLDLINTRCSEKKCVCKNGYKYESGECREEPPEDCSEVPYCRGWNKECIFGLCRTPAAFFESASTEILDRYAADYLYGACQTDHHCRNLNNSRCHLGKCNCLHGWEQTPNGCQKPRKVNCSDESDCLPGVTRCLLNNCLRPGDFFVSSNADQTNLYAAKHIYDDCRSDHHCRNLLNTYCFENTCNCLSGYEYVDGFCQKAINVTCSNDFDCMLPRSFCFLNICLYPEDFLVPSNGYNISLYAAKRINGFCQTNYHCREIEDSKCFRRKCTCKDQYYPDGDRCSNSTTFRI